MSTVEGSFVPHTALIVLPLLGASPPTSKVPLLVFGTRGWFI